LSIGRIARGSSAKRQFAKTDKSGLKIPQMSHKQAANVGYFSIITHLIFYLTLRAKAAVLSLPTALESNFTIDSSYYKKLRANADFNNCYLIK
jgi:hypothetical protein